MRTFSCDVTRTDTKTVENFLEFFATTIRHRNTRRAYYRACQKFLTWCESRSVRDLTNISPMLVAAFIEEETSRCEPQTVKQELAAIRKLFDYLVDQAIGAQ